MFFSSLRGPAAFASLVVVAASAWAQPALSLQEAQALAVARSQQLAAQDAASNAVREMAAAAGRLPDPVLKLGVDNLPVNGPDRLSLSRDFMTMRRIGLMQEIPREEKRQLKVERLERDGERIQAERALAIASIRRDTALAWLDRHYAQAMRDLLVLQVEEARLQVQGAEAVWRSGRGNQADVFAARSALAGMQDRLRELERQAANATLMLARWTGPGAAAQTASREASWNSATFIAALEQQHRRHPQLAALAAQVRAAETEVRQAQADTRPDWTVEASYSQRGSSYSNMVSIGVSVPLQLDRANRQDRETAAKLSAVAESRARLEDALAAHDAEVRVALNDWNAGKERLARLAAELLPAARLRSEAAQTSYRTGKGDLASVLTARRDEIDARIQLLALETETARIWARLNYLTSEQP